MQLLTTKRFASSRQIGMGLAMGILISSLIWVAALSLTGAFTESRTAASVPATDASSTRQTAFFNAKLDRPEAAELHAGANQQHINPACLARICTGQDSTSYAAWQRGTAWASGFNLPSAAADNNSQWLA